MGSHLGFEMLFQKLLKKKKREVQIGLVFTVFPQFISTIRDAEQPDVQVSYPYLHIMTELAELHLNNPSIPLPSVLLTSFYPLVTVRFSPLRPRFY